MLYPASTLATTMAATWSTRQPVGAAIVTVGTAPTNLTRAFLGVAAFTDVNNTQYLHRVAMTGLDPGTQYWYSVGDGAGNASAALTFHTWSPDRETVRGGASAGLGVVRRRHLV